MTRMGEARGYAGFRLGNLRERDRFGDEGVEGRIILKWIFKQWDVVAWTGLIWLKIGIDVGLL